MKISKTKLIISSIIILLPMLAGIVLWNVLPDVLDTHWDLMGKVDGRGGKNLVTFFLPLFLLATHLLCLFITLKDRSNNNQTRKASGMIYWICPSLSVYCFALIFAHNMGVKISPSALTLIFIGVLFVVIGNYMPKCRQNLTIGIKLKWTLGSEANWNATHRFAGKVWTAGGVLMLMVAFVPSDWIMLALLVLIAVLVILPTIYSYKFYKRELSEGKTEKALPISKHYSKKAIIFIWVFSAAITVFCLIVCFTGKVTATVGEQSLEVKATFWGGRTLEYEDIASVEYRDNDKAGARLNGIGSPRLNAGMFENSEYGLHDRYSYAKTKSAIVLKELDGDIIVISLSTDNANKDLYNAIIQKTGGEQK